MIFQNSYLRSLGKDFRKPMVACIKEAWAPHGQPKSLEIECVYVYMCMV